MATAYLSSFAFVRSFIFVVSIQQAAVVQQQQWYNSTRASPSDVRESREAFMPVC